MTDNKKIVLASASPRRKELITVICENVLIRPADCDETLPDGIGAKEAVEYLSKIKNDAARKISEQDEIVISADTVVAVENRILGKPVDKADAEKMIRLLSGKTHQVYTGVTISSNVNSTTFSVCTDVKFYSLTDEEIEDYISGDEPYDKAGAYAVQGDFAKHIESINGDYYNVVGLPVSRLYRELMAFTNIIENEN